MVRHMLIAVAALWAVASSVQAEFRIWEDARGNVVEGEFMALSGDDAVLRGQDGREIRLDSGGLCIADREYLDRTVPPQLDIDVSKTTGGEGAQGQSESVRCLATLRQADRRAYGGGLVAVLVVMGEDLRTGAAVPLSTTEHRFTLPERRGEAVGFASGWVRFSGKTGQSGRAYSGYLLVVWDRFGAPIAVKTNRPTYGQMAARIAAPSRSAKAGN